MRGAAVVVGVVRDGDVRTTVVVVVAGESGAVDADAFGVSVLLLHAAEEHEHRGEQRHAANAHRGRLRVAFAYYPSP